MRGFSFSPKLKSDNNLCNSLILSGEWMTPQYNPNRMESISGKFLDVLILSIWLMSPAPLSNTPMYWNQPYLPFFLPSLLPPAEDDKMWDFAITHNYWVKISYAAFNTFYSIAVGQLFLVAAVFPSLYTRKLSMNFMLIDIFFLFFYEAPSDT